MLGRGVIYTRSLSEYSRTYRLPRNARVAAWSTERSIRYRPRVGAGRWFPLNRPIFEILSKRFAVFPACDDTQRLRDYLVLRQFPRTTATIGNSITG